jgi:hypothetical protein
MCREAVLRRFTTSRTGKIRRKFTGVAQGRKPDRDCECRRSLERNLRPKRRHRLQGRLFNGKQISGSIARVLGVRTRSSSEAGGPNSV